MATPVKNLTIVPSLRMESDTWNANSSGNGTSGTDTQPYSGNGNGEMLDVRERLDARVHCPASPTGCFPSAANGRKAVAVCTKPTAFTRSGNGSPGPPLSWPSRMKRAGSRNIPFNAHGSGTLSAASSLTPPDIIINGTNTITISSPGQHFAPNGPTSGNTYPAYLTILAGNFPNARRQRAGSDAPAHSKHSPGQPL